MTLSASHFELLFRPLNDAESKFAPKELYFRGCDTYLSEGVRVSVIGSRKASTEGLKRARKLACILAQKDITVVSGLAEGIDTAAHTGAIECGGKTIAVLGTPLSNYYPKENRALQDKIAKEHLLVSQFKEGTRVFKGNFPTRNRLMALISDATVIVEAKDGSGTEHQGWEALRLARPLWIMKSSVDDPTLNWPAQFIKYGAQVLADDSLDSFFEMLPSGQSSSDYDAISL